MTQQATADAERFEILKSLDGLGYSFLDLDQLKYSELRYADAVPLLAGWLLRSQFWENKQILIGVLSKKWAKAAVPALVETFRSDIPAEYNPMMRRWAIASAIDTAYDDACAPDIIALALDRSYGMSRQMLATALGRSKRPEAADALFSLADDPAIDGHVTEALAKRPTEEARPVFERMVHDDRSWVRKKAAKALERLDAAKVDRAG